MSEAVEWFIREREYNEARHISARIGQIINVYKLPSGAVRDLLSLQRYSDEHAEHLFKLRGEVKAIFWPEPVE